MNGDPAQSPWYLSVAISHALMVLGFFELMDEDRPAERIWLDDEALTHHFNQVAERRGVSARGDGDMAPVDLTQNELTAEFRSG